MPRGGARVSKKQQAAAAARANQLTPEFAAFLIRSLNRNDQELAALQDIHHRLRALRQELECRGPTLLLELGRGQIRLTTATATTDDGEDSSPLPQDTGSGMDSTPNDNVVIVDRLMGTTEETIQVVQNLEQKLRADEQRQEALGGISTQIPLHDLAVSFLLHSKLRHRLLSRLSRRLLRVAHAMDNNKMPEAPQLPSYGDLRLHVDPNAVQALEQVRHEKERILQQQKKFSNLVAMTTTATSSSSPGVKKEESADAVMSNADGDVKSMETESVGSSQEPSKEEAEKSSSDKQETKETQRPSQEVLESCMPRLEYQVFLEYKDAYEKRIPVVESSGKSAPDEATPKYTLLEEQEKPKEDYELIPLGSAGIGALPSSRLMTSMAERQQEFQRFQNSLLQKIPPQPPLPSKVYHYKERLRIAQEKQKELDEQEKKAAAVVVSPSKVGGGKSLRRLAEDLDGDRPKRRQVIHPVKGIGGKQLSVMKREREAAEQARKEAEKKKETAPDDDDDKKEESPDTKEESKDESPESKEEETGDKKETPDKATDDSPEKKTESDKEEKQSSDDKVKDAAEDDKAESVSKDVPDADSNKGEESAKVAEEEEEEMKEERESVDMDDDDDVFEDEEEGDEKSNDKASKDAEEPVAETSAKKEEADTAKPSDETDTKNDDKNATVNSEEKEDDTAEKESNAERENAEDDKNDMLNEEEETKEERETADDDSDDFEDGEEDKEKASGTDDMDVDEVENSEVKDTDGDKAEEDEPNEGVETEEKEEEEDEKEDGNDDKSEKGEDTDAKKEDDGKEENKEAPKKEAKDEEEEVELKRPISLVPTPSFYDQDLKRIKLIHGELMASSMRDHARVKMEGVTRDYNACLRASNELYDHRQSLQGQLTRLINENRTFINGLQTEYQVKYAMARNDWVMRQREADKKKLDGLMPHRHNPQYFPEGTSMTNLYIRQPDQSRQIVAQYVGSMVDAVSNLERGIGRINTTREEFRAPQKPEPQILLKQQMEGQVRQEITNVSHRLRVSEEKRSQMWRRMMKAKAEFELPHYHLRTKIDLNMSNYQMVQIPPLRQSSTQSIPQEVVRSAMSQFASYVPQARQNRPVVGGDLESKYSAAKVKERIASDGSVAPVTAPKRSKDGLFQRPAGRTRKGMNWDALRGIWVPAPYN